jgi:long-chain-fatty-acid--[acyl-carrier-protein] ligase
VGGEMVSLTAIEEALLETALKQHWTKKEEGPLLAVCGKEIPGEKPKISLFCKFPTNVDEINKALREAGFSNLIKVTSVNQLAEIPIMGTGKVNYRKLEET